MPISFDEALRRIIEATAEHGDQFVAGRTVENVPTEKLARLRFSDRIESQGDSSGLTHLWIDGVDGPEGFGVVLRDHRRRVSYGNKDQWGA